MKHTKNKVASLTMTACVVSRPLPAQPLFPTPYRPWTPGTLQPTLM